MGTAIHYTQTDEFKKLQQDPGAPRNQIQKLHQRHRLIIQYHVAGWTNSAIAEELNVSTKMVLNTVNSDLGQSAIERFANEVDTINAEVIADATAKLQESSGKAVETLVNIMEDTEAPEMARIKAADSVLDRSGYKPVSKVEVHKRESVYSRTEIEHIREQAKEAIEAKQLPAPLGELTNDNDD